METTAVESLREHAYPLVGPEGEEILSLQPADLEEVAREFELSLRRVQVLALQAGLLPERYLRSLGTVGWAGQCRLLESCVAVIGCGGLGGHVMESLARSGVGQLIVADPDSFVPHNLNRQLFCTMADLGRPKVEVARERVAGINPAVEVVAHAVAATEENLPGLLEKAAVVVDALDNVPDRLILEAAASHRRIPLVHGAIAGLMGQVTTVFPGDDTLALLYGTGTLPEQGAESLLGTPAVTPQLVAAFQAAETLKLLLGRGDTLRRQVLYIDLESGLVERFLFPAAQE
jgi:molybdopterin/thiamine biosynthesis adenylyltransferase